VQLALGAAAMSSTALKHSDSISDEFLAALDRFLHIAASP